MAKGLVGRSPRASAACWAAATSLSFGVAPLATLPALATEVLATRITLPAEVTATFRIALEISIEWSRCCM